MAVDYRKSGLEVIDDIPWGTHICQFYRTKDDLIDTLVPYFSSALENNEFCMWITSEPLDVKEAKEYLGKAISHLDDYTSKGQIEILDYREWYAKSGKFNADEAFQGLVDKEADALAKGFDGLRYACNASWLKAKDWVAFREYEGIVDNIIGEHRMIDMCGYSLGKCAASQVLDILNNYEIAIIKRQGQWRTVESDERKRLKKVLSGSEVRFRRLFETAQDGILILDAKTGQITEVNPFLKETLGYANEELVGKLLWEIGMFKDIAKSKDAFEQLQSGGYIRYEDLQMETKDGKPVDVEFVSNIYEVENKKLIQCNIRNVIKRPETEELSKRYKVLLETLIEQRTQELAESNRRLEQELTALKKLQVQLAAQDRLESIGELVSGVAHEINNPLTGVIGFSDLLLERDLPEDVKGNLKIVNAEAKRTAIIVNNLLTFARKQPEGKGPVDINDTVQRVITIRAYEQKVNNIQVIIHCSLDLPQITANSSQLHQVFFNIVVNAEQAMFEANGKGTLTITTEQVGDFVRISFVDDGPGISPENLNHIFMPFFTTKEVGKGTGLGLSISYGIVTEHGGRLYAQSEPGKGAAFIVELPIEAH